MEFIDLSFIIFGQLDSLEYSPKNITDFLVSFQKNDLNLLPNPIQITFLDESGSKKVERMGFVDSKQNLNIALLPESINITKQKFIEQIEEPLESHVDSFILECKKIINAIFDTLENGNFKGTRIALLANIYTDPSKLKEEANIFGKYRGNSDEEKDIKNLVEWSNRRTFRIDVEEIGEFINIVKNVGKNEGNLVRDGEIVSSNTVQINYDINTAGNINLPRIDKIFSQNFLLKSSENIDFSKIRGELYNDGK